MAIANGGIGLDSPLLDRINRCFADDRASAYIVGGYLRDALRDRSSGGISQHDLDIAVEGDSERIARSLARHLGGSIAPLDPTRGIFRVMAPADQELRGAPTLFYRPYVLLLGPLRKTWRAGTFPWMQWRCAGTTVKGQTGRTM